MILPMVANILSNHIRFVDPYHNIRGRSPVYVVEIRGADHIAFSCISNRGHVSSFIIDYADVYYDIDRRIVSIEFNN